jgi:hemoglobin-like flavoprotein
MALDAEAVCSSLELVASRQLIITKRFYEIFFSRYPQARPMFSRNAPERQQRMLIGLRLQLFRRGNPAQ